MWLPRFDTVCPVTPPSSPAADATPRAAFGVGLATLVQDTDTVLDVWYPSPRLGEGTDDEPTDHLTGLEGGDQVRGVDRVVVRTQVADLQAPPSDTADAWLRLHLLSHRLVAPRTVDLDGIFGLLTNVVWTDHGPCPVEGFELTRARLTAAYGRVTVLGVDKFPRMTDYVLPSGVRIADADRVRLGAHLANGTTVMHEGFVNYNAGTKVLVSDGDTQHVLKARDLSGSSNILFRRNSTTGAVEAVPWKGDGIALNAALHAND